MKPLRHPRHSILGQKLPAKPQRHRQHGTPAPSPPTRPVCQSRHNQDRRPPGSRVPPPHGARSDRPQPRQVSERFTLCQRDASAAAPSSRYTGPALTPAQRCRRAPGLRPRPDSSPNPMFLPVLRMVTKGLNIRAIISRFMPIRSPVPTPIQQHMTASRDRQSG